MQFSFRFHGFINTNTKNLINKMAFSQNSTLDEAVKKHTFDEVLNGNDGYVQLLGSYRLSWIHMNSLLLVSGFSYICITPLVRKMVNFLEFVLSIAISTKAPTKCVHVIMKEIFSSSISTMVNSGS